MDNLFVRAWKGQASLAAAFWIVYFIVTIILYLITTAIVGAIWPNLRTSPILGPLAGTIVFPYVIYAVISVWRCSNNSHIVWKILARIVVVLAILGGIFNIAMLLGFHA